MLTKAEPIKTVMSPFRPIRCSFASNAKDRYSGKIKKSGLSYLSTQRMMKWSKDGLPFIIDCYGHDGAVWPFPFDRVSITEFNQGPAGFTGTAPSGSKFYNVVVQGTGFFEDKVRRYYAWIAPNGLSNWIDIRYASDTPVFIRRPQPIGDLTDKANWQVRGCPSNPEVDLQVVYEIYMQSLESPSNQQIISSF